jgi:hypothetical protein
MVEKRVLMRGMAREYSRWPKILPASPLAVALTLACLVLHGQQATNRPPATNSTPPVGLLYRVHFKC